MLNDYDDFLAEFLNPYELGYLLKDPTFANAYHYLPQLIKDLSMHPVDKIIEMLEGRQEELSDGAIRTNMLPWDSDIQGEHYMPFCLDIEEWRNIFLQDADTQTMQWDEKILEAAFNITTCPQRWMLWADCVCNTSLSGYSKDTLVIFKNLIQGMNSQEIWNYTPSLLSYDHIPLQEEFLCL